MNIALFYQLRERLRASAIAGCNIIGEDFRLKRAVEEFEPLANANKVFAKLHTMCNELFTSDKPAPILADCIALCDALAVTQGVFRDNSETAEIAGVRSSEPSDIRYSALKDDNLHSKDPRVINEYLKPSKLHRADGAKQYITQNFGSDIVPALKDRLDLSNPKENGKIVQCIGELAKAEENDWYISLIENEDNPPSVRESAVICLGYDKSNAGKLIELYRTGKAKIKDAAATALIPFDTPESEFVLNKITSGRFLKKNAELISISESKTALDFAVDYAEKMLADKSISDRYDIYTAISMLANKTGIEDILMKIAAGYDAVIAKAVAEMLLVNIGKHKDEKYRVLIENLYKNKPDLFTMPYLLMITAEDRGFDITDFPKLTEKYRYNLLNVFRGIYYDDNRKCYIMPARVADCSFYNESGATTCQSLKIDGIPIADGKIHKILEFVSDTSYMKTPILKLRLMKRSVFQNSKNIVRGDEYVNYCITIASGTLKNLYRNPHHNPCAGDKDKIYQLMIGFCREGMNYFPNYCLLGYIVEFDTQYFRENPDLLEKWVMFSLENFDTRIPYYYFSKAIPKDMIDTVIPKLYKKLKSLKITKTKIKKETLSEQIHNLEIFMPELRI